MLTGKQRHYLRGLAHALDPVVHLGKRGLDDSVIAAIDRALLDHELIKVKVGEGAALDRHEAADAVAAKTKSEVAQVLGNIVVLYKPRAEKPTIVLPTAAEKSDKPVKAAKAAKPDDAE